MVDRRAAAVARVKADLPETLAKLAQYVKIPAISCEEARRGDVRRLAETIAGDLSALGMHKARVLTVKEPKAHPLVAAEWMQAGPDKPTVLIYGHLDLQPVGEPEWIGDPHVVRQDGDRLYARGIGDDMGGWVSHLAAIRAWMVNGGPPCNLRLVIEGEEEIGSPYLEHFMDEHPDAFVADVMVLTDCENPSPEIPGLTVSLRGLLEVELRCEALDADVHSGMWGNLAPDPANALFLLVARLLDADGRLGVGRVEVDDARVKAGFEVPLDAATIREGAHLADGVEPLPLRGKSAAEWIWWQPAITVVATTLPTPAQKKNAVRRAASATLSVRLAPGQSGEAMLAVLNEELLRQAPGGVKVSLTPKSGWGDSWLYQPKGPAFEAAERAYQEGWGRGLVRVGIGGTIPFVAMFGRRFGDLPLILNGVLDPRSTAHGPNESMHLGLFEKMLITNVHLYAELGALDKATIRG